MDRRKIPTGPIATAAIVLFAVPAYFSAYYFLCTPGDDWIEPAGGTSYLVPDYQSNSRVAETVFWPAHLIDRRLRPGIWQVEIAYVPVEEELLFDDVPQASICCVNPYDAYMKQGSLEHVSGNLKAAMESFTSAIDVNPEGYQAYITRGVVRQDLGEWQAAMADYEKAREIAPDNFAPWNNLAMLLAACPDDGIRNGAQAAEYAQKACELTEWKHPAALNTLAIAYAELGDWQAATDICDTQLGQLADGPLADEFKMLREMFVQEKAYRLKQRTKNPRTAQATAREHAKLEGIWRWREGGSVLNPLLVIDGASAKYVYDIESIEKVELTYTLAIDPSRNLVGFLSKKKIEFCLYKIEGETLTLYSTDEGVPKRIPQSRENKESVKTTIWDRVK